MLSDRWKASAEVNLVILVRLLGVTDLRTHLDKDKLVLEGERG